MKICNPSTLEVIQEVTPDDKGEIEQKFKVLQKGQKAWAQQELVMRLECIERFSSLLKQNTEDLAQKLSSEMGKPIQQARNEIIASRQRIEFFTENSAKWLMPHDVQVNEEIVETLVYEPLGVIANISAWNYPYLVGVNVFVPALIGGNAVVYKPSEYATLTGLAIQELLYEAGIPEDVFSSVIGAANEGEHLLDLPFDGYFFTGSVKTGKHIAERIAHKLVPLGLELGGKDPLYVTDDLEDIRLVAGNCVDGSFYNNGQSCCGVERIYVHQSIYEEFLDHFVDIAKELKMGNPFEEGIHQGPLARSVHIPFLLDQIQDAKDKGARVLLGGNKINEIFLEPTILVNVDHTMKIMQEESFGPIIGIQKVTGDLEAIELMEDTAYGLTASVFSKDIARARGILDKLNVGTAYINCCDRVSPYLPWSGRKQSGLGSTLSYLGILAFVQPKAYQIRS
ncbi:MAG: acyl-CoA reductase-like NAD-dependent aldehyde dehydrogenase [Chlamydiales bacterium]|jgi:acyl-CoA reductase-like NAD-dependent aldehyde dehydrogenase